MCSFLVRGLVFAEYFVSQQNQNCCDPRFDTEKKMREEIMNDTFEKWANDFLMIYEGEAL